MAQTITGELYDVYREMGGTEKSRPTIAGMIDLIQRQISGGGGGDGGIFIVNVTAEYDEQTEETTYTADKTMAEILAAYENGKIPYAKYHGSRNSGPLLCVFNNGYYEDGAGNITFSGAQWLAEQMNVSFNTISIDADGESEVCFVDGNVYNFPTA